MAYEYGSDSQKITNPLKREGLIITIGGLLIAIIGIISVIMLRGKIQRTNELSEINGWANLITSITILVIGGSQFITGLFRMFKLYVGRGMPGDLANNKEQDTIYDANTLEEMLEGRVNLTFQEPKQFMVRFVYNFFPSFLFLPYPIRNFIHRITYKITYTIIFLCIYLIALLSGSIGLTQLMSTSFGAWLGIVLFIALLMIWIPKNMKVTQIGVKEPIIMNISRFVGLVILGILIPVLGEVALRNGFELPEAPINPTFYLVLVMFLAIATTVISFYLAKLRSDVLSPNTEVSEYRNHWQYNLHPKDLFTSFNLQMAELRFMDIPNRVYRELKPKLATEGSMDKGSFEGKTIQETQPKITKLILKDRYKMAKIIATITGEFFIVIGAITLVRGGSFNQEVNFLLAIILRYYISAVFLAFGTMLLNISHICWTEISFKSTLISFSGEGTYSESKFSVGMAITDSTRSENQIVRTSFAPVLFVSDILTTTFIGLGTKRLDGPRYIMEMNKSEQLLDCIVNGLTKFGDSRGVIASTVSQKDAEAINDIYKLNSLSKRQGDIQLNAEERAFINEEVEEG